MVMGDELKRGTAGSDTAIDSAEAQRLLRLLVESKAIDFDVLAKVLAQAAPVGPGDKASAKSPKSFIRLYTNVVRVLGLEPSAEGTLSDPAQIKAAVNRALGN